MKEIQIKFNSLGHEPYFDFLKAFAILCVLIGHTFPYIDKIAYPLWAGMQVPFFVLIQAFHTLKKDSSKLNLKKLFYRIFIPYLIILGVIILVYLLTGRMNNQIAYKGLIGGGYGPGSYFPWIYIQLAIVLHFVQPLFKKWGTSFQTFLWLSICIGFELLESYICLPDQIHRLLAIRYLFLIYLGWIWVKKGIVINIFTITLSFLSVISIVYFAYFNCNNEPIFYTTNWSYHRWPCYFYVSTLLGFLLILIYQRISKFSFINRTTIFLARCSYEIFLIQMAVIALIPRFNNLGNKYLALFLWIIVVWAISLIGGYFFNLIYSKYFDSVK